MPLFEIDSAGELVPFRRLRGGENLYERQIEELAWANPEEVVGESLFLVQRQPHLQVGGVPDIVALDREARVVVIEVKREFERQQLAQCLEYAGWARRCSYVKAGTNTGRFVDVIVSSGIARSVR